MISTDNNNEVSDNKKQSTSYSKIDNEIYSVILRSFYYLKIYKKPEQIYQRKKRKFKYLKLIKMILKLKFII